MIPNSLVEDAFEAAALDHRRSRGELVQPAQILLAVVAVVEDPDRNHSD